MKHENIYKLTLTALMAALSYVVFTFLQIKVTLPGGDATSFHLGNVRYVYLVHCFSAVCMAESAEQLV